MHSVEKSISLNSGIFKCFITLEKNEISVLAFSSSLVIILSSCTNAIFSEDFALSEKRYFAVFRTSYCLSHLPHSKFRNNIFQIFSKDLYRNFVACCNRLYLSLFSYFLGGSVFCEH